MAKPIIEIIGEEKAKEIIASVKEELRPHLEYLVRNIDVELGVSPPALRLDGEVEGLMYPEALHLHVKSLLVDSKYVREKSLPPEAVKELSFHLGKLIENVLFKVEEEGGFVAELNVEPHRLAAEHVGRKIRMECVIAGESQAKAIPKYIMVSCPYCNPDKIDFSKPRNWDHLRKWLFNKRQFLKEIKAKHNHDFRSPVEICECSPMIDYRIVYVRPILKYEKFSEQTYRTVTVHVIGKKIPVERRVEVKGVVVTDSKNNITVLAYDVKPLQQIWDIKVTEKDHELFRKYFNPEGLEDRLDRTIATYIVGRKKAKIAAALTHHSPLEIVFKGRRILAVLKTCFLGTSTTGKSETAESSKKDFDLGDFIDAEMSKSTGLVGAVDPESKTITWGILVLNDKGLVGLDGIHNISDQDLAMLKEGLRKGYIDITKAVRGRGYMRTRIIATANPLRGSVEEYLYPVEAIRDCKPFRDPVNITRWDLFIKFSEKDVSDKEIAKAYKTEPEIPVEVYRKHVAWAWSLKAEDIVFTQEAVESIGLKYLEIADYKLPEIPLISAEFPTRLAKLAASYAILTHNVVDGKVIVEPKHVEWAYKFYMEVLEDWEYFDYFNYVMGLRELTEEEIARIEEAFLENYMLRRVFEEITKKPGIEARTLAERLNTSKQTIINYVAKLKALELVESRERKRGYWLTRKGLSYALKIKKELLKPKENQKPQQRLDQILPVDQKKGYPPTRTVLPQPHKRREQGAPEKTGGTEKSGKLVKTGLITPTSEEERIRLVREAIVDVLREHGDGLKYVMVYHHVAKKLKWVRNPDIEKALEELRKEGKVQEENGSWKLAQ